MAIRTGGIVRVSCDRCARERPAEDGGSGSRWARVSALHCAEVRTSEAITVIDLCPDCLEALAGWLGKALSAARRPVTSSGFRAVGE